MITETFYTIPEVSKIFKVSRTYLYNLMKQNKLKTIYMGGIRVPESEIIRIINSEGIKHES